MERFTGFNESADLQDESIGHGDDVFDKISSLNEQIKTINQEIENVKTASTMYNTQVGNAFNTKAELKSITTKTDDLSRKLRAVTEEYDKVRQTLEAKTSDTTDKDKERLASLRDNISKAMARLMGIESELKGNVRQKVIRVVEAQLHDNRTLEDADIDKILEVGLDQVVEAQVSGEELEIDTLLSRAANTYQGLTKLNQSINELHQMCMDFGLLVEDQAVRLKATEQHVLDAKENVETGKEELGKGLEEQKKAKKKKKCIIIILVAALLGIAIVTGTIVAIAI